MNFRTKLGCAIRIAAVISALSFTIGPPATAETVRERELERMKLNKKFDKEKLRERDTFVVDTSTEFLVAPKDASVPSGVTTAQTPPTIKMQVIPGMDPEYFTDLEEFSEAYMVYWANWARVARSDDNRFFFAVSDHRGMGCHIFVYEYSPVRNLIRKVVDVGKVLNWTDESLTDGKIHGHMGIMADGTLWAATHYGVFPDDNWWKAGYRGSWLFSYNINTYETHSYGVPLVGNMLPCFNVDTRRGRLVGTGSNLTMLCWDTVNKQVRFAGYPPNGWQWWERAMLCDESTGKFWSTENSDGKNHFISFDPELNRFEKYEQATPIHPSKGVNDRLRGYTDWPAADGYFYCSTHNGVLFKFKPEADGGPEVQPLGINWGDGMDVMQMMVSPKGRYVYYLPREYPSPLVQLDVTTGQRKIICWLNDYYFDRYGYWIGGSYGMEISKDGSFILINMNGSFHGRGENYGNPAVFIIEIPNSERTE